MPIGGSHSPASDLGGLEENGVGGARHTIKTGSATQKTMNPGALMTSRRCCAGHLQTDVTSVEGKLQVLHARAKAWQGELTRQRVQS